MKNDPIRPVPMHALLKHSALTLVLLAMCSCQSLTTQSRVTKSSQADQPSPARQAPTPLHDEESRPSNPPRSTPDSLPAAPAKSARAIVSAPCPHCQPGLPGHANGDFCRWPDNEFQPARVEEYVCNGGDQNVQVQVKRDWSVQGLHPGDTVVHYDTLAGKTIVEPSNEVCLYAPRFAAVRKVYGIVSHEQHDRVAGVDIPLGPELSSDRGQATTVVQPLQPARKHSHTAMRSFLENTRGIGIDNAQRPAIAEEKFLPFEDLAIIRRGMFDNTEKARLNERLLAAIAWTHTQGLQVLLDNRNALEAVGTKGPQSVYTYEVPPGKARLRVVKIASRQNAKPGELVEFTLRFDNVGDETIGNVTVIDRLHDRLELVPDSARCSLPAEFSTEDEDGSPRVLRWEITDPLKVSAGGLIRFTCRVR